MSAESQDLRRAVIGVDTGGTFTDVTLLDLVSGRVWNAKTPSTPDDPSRGFADGIAKVLEISGVPATAVARVLHGTTVATNLILENKGPKTGMLVTDGFKFVVEIGRQDVPRGENLHAWVKPRRPIRPQHIWQIRGRIDHRGRELHPLDESAIRLAAEAMVADGIVAVSIVFLHSYASPAHERRAAEILREVAPGLLITLSSEVMPVFREYERSMTANLNAYVMAAVSSYVARLEDRVRDIGIRSPLMLMKSSGGVTSVRTVRQRPVETALSGPAAGGVGANFVGGSAGETNMIGIDIGGTSADISLIYNGELGLTDHGRIGDWPIGLPMVDIATIGAGGGSIARLSSSGILTVGPESAGAAPGPVCYGRGGLEPTVTDAHLVLGHLPPYLLGGSFRLDLEAATDAIRTRIAKPLGMSVERAAQGILRIADNSMVGALRIVSVERGFDPRDFALVPFGGAGPLHGGSLARAMGMRRMLVPPAPGVLSALGLLASNLKAEFARTCMQRSDSPDLAILGEVFRTLERAAIKWLDDEQVPADARDLRRVASLRYQNQGFELSVPWQGNSVDAAAFVATIEEFHVTHERIYSFAQRDTIVEITTIRVDAVGTFPRPRLSELAPAGNIREAVTDTVSMVVDDARVQAPVYNRDLLGAGAEIAGPCLVVQLDSTVLLLPGQVGVVQRLGALLVTDTTV